MIGGERVTLRRVRPPDEVPPDTAYPTHMGEYHVPEFGTIRVYRMSDGRRVVDEDDVAVWAEWVELLRERSKP